jgi:hypothetical protein
MSVPLTIQGLAHTLDRMAEAQGRQATRLDTLERVIGEGFLRIARVDEGQSQVLDSHTGMLEAQARVLTEQGRRLDEISQQLNGQKAQLDEILGLLRPPETSQQ